MPLIRIATKESLNVEMQEKVSAAIQESIEGDLKAPPRDQFQIFSAHGSSLVFDKSFMNIDRSDRTIFIQVFLKKGRTPEMKKAFYANLCQRLVAAGARPEDVFITLCENDAIDWSFGNGLAQLAKD